MPTSKSTRFRRLLQSPQLDFIMEAHNGLSAKIVEEAGFNGVWASGLTISSALGVRDSNEASWTQVLDVLEFMTDATSIPIMLDGDTGYGNFNNFRRLVRKLEQRGVAAVCIEDKVFPKTNSFIGSNQPLADIDEFCGKIKAGKDSQADEDFSIVARIEALVSGRSMDEALRRAEAYHDAGADALLIHSKKSDPGEILTFTREWANRCPVVIVPTTYGGTPTDRFREAGISMVIWANHNLRSAISAMQRTSRRIFEDESIHAIESHVAGLHEVFAYAGNEELAQAEARYLKAHGAASAILLARSRNGRPSDLRAGKPSFMRDVRGQPLLHRSVRSLRDAGIKTVTVAVGHPSEVGSIPDIEKVVSPNQERRGEIASLACAKDALTGECVIGYADTMFRGYMPALLLRSTADITILADATSQGERTSPARRIADWVRCSQPLTTDYADDMRVTLERIERGLRPGGAHGEWTGLIKLSGRGADLVRSEFEKMEAEGNLANAELPDLINRLIERGETPAVIYVTGGWFAADDIP